MHIRAFLFLLVSMFLILEANAQDSDFDEIFNNGAGGASTGSRTTVSKLAKLNKAIVIAGGRYTSERLLVGKVKGSLTGYFFKNPNKPRQTFYGGADELLIKSGYGSNGHRVSEVDAGSWIMYSWLGQMPYVNVSPRDSFKRPMAKFKIKPGQVLYIGELHVNHYVDTDSKGNQVFPKPLELKKNLKAARAALKSEYPNLVKHMRFQPMKMLK